MILTQEQIKKLSLNFGKIRLETDSLAEDIKGILSYVDLLSEVDTTGVESTISIISRDNELREDTPNETIKPEDLLNCSNQKVVGRQIALANIMN